MPRTKKPPADENHLQRCQVIELPYLDNGGRVFVTTDERGWAIAQETAPAGASASQVDAILTRLNDVLDEYQARPRFTLVRNTPDAAGNDSNDPSSYRECVVQLPFPDRFGRKVLLAIDGNGRIFDQMPALNEAEAQRMTEDMENARQRLTLVSR